MTVQSIPAHHPTLRPLVRSFMLMEIAASARNTYARLTVPASDITAMLFPLSGCGAYTLDGMTGEVVKLENAFMHGQISRANSGGSGFSGAADENLAMFGIIFTPIGLQTFVRKEIGAMETIENAFHESRYLVKDSEFLHEKLSAVYDRKQRESGVPIPIPSTNLQGLAAYAERFLLEQLRCKPIPRGVGAERNVLQVQYICQRLTQTHGNISIEALAGELDLSERHISRLMKDYVGVSGEVFGEVQRFMYASQSLLSAVRAVPEGSTVSSERLHTIIHEAGYYDQSHCIRDFKRFAGATPFQFVRERTALAERLIGVDEESGELFKM
ncbi:MAG: helix-turn-helix domain-containing protein [Ignavibacteria bacterium]|nr:helix-turn-helix domain-containing protein [Ignavibacteria bacterium]